MRFKDKYISFFRRGACLLLAACLSLGALSGCALMVSEKEGTEIIMDTIVTINIAAKAERIVYDAEDQGGSKSFFWDRAYDIYHELIGLGKDLEKKELSRFEPESEIYKINASAGDPEGYPLSEEMEEILKTCLEISDKTDGAFDISIGALIDLWNIEGAVKEESEFRVPSGEEIKKALSKCGYEKIKIDNHRIFIPEGMILDLGAVGKGIYLDRTGIREDDILRGTVSAGGSIRTIGSKPDGKPWYIAITDPFKKGTSITMTPVTGDALVSTSGNYERYIDLDGTRYHHILDPATGKCADSGFVSVTVILPEKEGERRGLLTDALSTAIFILGEDFGEKVVKEHGAKVIMIRDDGEIVEFGN
ncbi:MAG: FAD:protein FMN transferase [Lachnospiraceae bacterium]|nr:FAD:protein FMN transferase [Lachnospiraceae bacterium]